MNTPPHQFSWMSAITKHRFIRLAAFLSDGIIQTEFDTNGRNPMVKSNVYRVLRGSLARTFLCLAFSSASAFLYGGQTNLTVVGYQIGEQGANHRVWQKLVRSTDAQGNTILMTNQAFVEMATGLNYQLSPA